MRRCIVAEGITIIANLIAEQIQKYQMSVRNLIMDAYKEEERFRKKLEYDTLTQVHSRVYINEIINGLFGLKDRDVPMGFAILDLDNFKSVNDTYGHGNGDKVLSALGEVLNKYASEDIIVGRFGGEEFIIIFKGEEQGKDFDTLDKIREEFARSSFDFMDRKVSFSSGLVNCTSSVLYEKVFNEADKALYVSKTQGKNMITVKNI